MATFYQPWIAATDYESFRRMVPGLPITYAKWELLALQEASQEQGRGHEVAAVHIVPVEFDTACRERGIGRTTDGLRHFAHQKAIAGG